MKVRFSIHCLLLSSVFCLPSFAQSSAENASRKYDSLCVTCHDDGGLAPDLLTSQRVRKMSDKAIKAIIRNGDLSLGMPSFDKALSDSELDALISYIRSGPTEMKAAQTKSASAIDENVNSLTDKVKVEDWVKGLDEPWSIAFLGPQEALVTEKKGTLRHIVNGKLKRGAISGTPKVTSKGQAGLFDVALDPNYAENSWIYLAFADLDTSGASMTKLVRGRIRDSRWQDEQVVFAARPEHYLSTSRHYGGRITFDDQGYLYLSVGDRGHKDMAQDLTKPNGKIHRIKISGAAPTIDAVMPNAAGGYDSIYAYGNRNPQGLVWEALSGVLWETEHGPKGGDELNAIKLGLNYGWPEISYGINYNGTELTPFTSKPGMEQPASYWTPSIAACGLNVYTGDLFPNWKGRLLAGSLKYQSLRLIEVDGDTYRSEAEILKDAGRIRDAITGPDGAIYVALPKKIVRLVPSGGDI